MSYKCCTGLWGIISARHDAEAMLASSSCVNFPINSLQDVCFCNLLRTISDRNAGLVRTNSPYRDQTLVLV